MNSFFKFKIIKGGQSMPGLVPLIY